MRTAIVTGAGSGIGRATALKLAQAGYAVALVGRTAAKLEAVAAESRAAGGTALCVTADVTRAEAVEGVVQQVVGMWGRVDVLVNNAGSAPTSVVAEVTVEQWHAILDSNLSSAFYAMRTVWPVLRRQHSTEGVGGTIINISSMASRDPFPGLGVYAVAKAGLNMLTLAAAREGHGAGIRVMGVAPAGVNTDMFAGLVGAGRVDPETILRPENVAAVVAEMAGGSLAFTSGETVFVHRGPV